MKFGNKSRAVSPVIATILLIALVVVASASIWLIASNLSSVNAELVVDSSNYFDLDNNLMVDKIVMKIRNIGGEETIISSIELTVDDNRYTAWQLVNQITLSVGSSGFLEILTLDPSQQITKENDNILTIMTSTNAIMQETLNIPSNFALSAIGEAGSLLVTDTPITVNLNGSYSNPVVVAVPVASSTSSVRGGTNAAQVHVITSVTGSSFTIQQKSDSTDSDGITETAVNYLVIEAGVHHVRSITIIAGIIEATGTVTTYDFPENFTSKPALFASTQTNDNGEVPHTRGDITNFNNFTMQIENGVNSNPGNSYRETVGFIAIESGYDLISGLQAYSTGDDNKHSWNYISYNVFYLNQPIVITHLASEDGGDSSYSVIADISTTGFYQSIEESNGKDGSHTTESIDWVAINSGIIYGTTSS
ncbi:MAG: type IV pilin [Candidatus Heimdallarchaeota archaeon]|nr:type IV pilin [Candidatus Heimdallarchaeota archaeon]